MIHPVLKGFKILILLLYIALILMLVLAVVTPFTGGSKFDLPSKDQVIIDIDGSDLTIFVPMKIKNGGVYDFNDISYSIVLQQRDGKEIANYKAPTVDLVSGEWNDLNLDFSIGLDIFDYDYLWDLIFNGTDLEVGLEFEGKYLYEMIQMKIGSNDTQSIEVPALIDQFSLNFEGAILDKTNSELEIPLSFNSPFFMKGMDFDLNVVLYNTTNQISTTSQKIQVADINNDRLTLPLDSNTLYQMESGMGELKAMVDIGIFGFNFTKDFEGVYQPEVNNFQITSAYVDLYYPYLTLNGQYDVYRPSSTGSVNLIFTVYNTTSQISTTTIANYEYSGTMVFNAIFYLDQTTWEFLLMNEDDWTVTIVRNADASSTHLVDYHWSPGGV